MKNLMETIVLIIDKYGIEKIKEISSYVEANTQASIDDFIIEGTGEFGFEINNPIPVFGLESIEIYLSKLRTKDGCLIRWKRTGSVISEVINRPIDKYEIYCRNNNFITYLYISPYHWVISKKSPNGFCILNNHFLTQ